MCFPIKNYITGRHVNKHYGSTDNPEGRFNGHYKGSRFTLDLQIYKYSTAVKKLPADVTNTVSVVHEPEDH